MLVRCHRQFNADLSLLTEMLGFISGFVLGCGFSPDKVKTIELASEEAIVNVINYAYKGLSGSEVSIQCMFQRPTLTVEIIDSGEAFNPLDAPDPDISDNLEDRKIGGLGISFIKRLVDEVYYRREGDKNILSLVLRLDNDVANV